MYKRQAVDEAKRAYPGESIVLKVRPFNKRAIKCYLGSGFELTETYYETKAHIAGEMCLMKMCIRDSVTFGPIIVYSPM